MFFVGTHRPNRAGMLDHAFISVNVLPKHAPILANEWVMDSGAFTEISRHGGYRRSVADYAERIREFARFDGLMAAVAQDYMCEPPILQKTGLTVRDHQRLTLERYDALLQQDVGGAYIMPVLQGFLPQDYARHVAEYDDRLAPGAWVGVGSVCKRNSSPVSIAQVLESIHAVRPDLRLHCFGVKLTSLKSDRVLRHVYSADSMAWSYNARRNGLDQNDVWIGRHYELMVLKATGWEPGDYARAFIGQLLRLQFDRWQREAADKLGRSEWDGSLGISLIDNLQSTRSRAASATSGGMNAS